MAFPERSAAPSRLPVHLHNVATCHMETGSTNLCLPPPQSRAAPLILLHVPIWPLLSASFPPFLSCRSLFFGMLVMSRIFGGGGWGGAETRRSSILFVLTRKKLSLWGAGETRFNTHIHRASGVLRGVRGPHVNTSCEDGGDREKG